MKTEIRSAIADILKQEGVEYLFGHTGGHIKEMRKAAAEVGIKLIQDKHEGNGVCMADAFARLTGKTAVVTGTSGPGVQSMVNGLASTYLDSVPLVVVGATQATFAADKNALQDASGRGRSTDFRIIVDD